MRVLVLGVTGMLGNAMYRLLSQDAAMAVYATSRNAAALSYFGEELHSRIISGVDVENYDSLVEVFGKVRPDVVINCIGLVKQLANADNPLQAVPINTLLPHRLAALCTVAKTRLIHVSTDCVFSGNKGDYQESDIPDAHDLYGRTKLLGEVDYPHAITLRTSIIGHELSGHRSLVGWFLNQNTATVKGYRRAIFSGLPTCELAAVVRDFVLPSPELHGLYHVSAEPINKYELLRLISTVYGKAIEVVPDDTLIIDRSLRSNRFRQATGYTPAPWPELINRMYAFK